MSSNYFSESSVYTERVTQGPDRVYRWKYTLRRDEALVHFKMMMKIGAIVTTVISVIFIFVFTYGAQGQPVFGIIVPYILLFYGLILGLPALIGYLALGSDTRSYEMDDTCIRHKHATRGGDAVVFFSKVSWAEELDNAIRLKEGITTYTMYAPPEDAAFVKEFIRTKVGNEKYDRIKGR